MAEVQILEARRNVPNSRSRNRVEALNVGLYGLF